MKWKVVGLKYTALGYIALDLQDPAKVSRMVILLAQHHDLTLGDEVEVDIRKVES
jgi:hypothetical protein